MTKIVLVPENWKDKAEICTSLASDIECRLYQDLSQVLKEVDQLIKQFDRIVLINEDAILPFMYCCKIPHLVAAPVFDEHSAYMTPLHNNTDLMCLGFEISTPILMASMIKTFFATPYEGERHKARIDMLDLETKGTV